ncbi:CPBP family intramembrane glutamic endopeptidase [Gracilibacillus xinjiangensis]|uniref:CPBP family intramembrane glutamic endopeptidase n=1 Tax=Gracilibacillus xinjiangensis TaxID=1193282 RepID=A0ABV8WVH0_9BACI
MEPVPEAMTSAIIKIVIWVIPVIILVKITEKTELFSYLGLRHSIRKGLKWAGGVSILFILYFLVLNIAFLEGAELQIGFNEWLNTIILVGITEEIVFRGFLLRKLLNSYRFWIANIITSILFVSIHFPIWFHKGLFEFPYILSATITAFILSMIFGFVYRKSNSLWSVIILHSFYNLLVSLFY